MRIAIVEDEAPVARRLARAVRALLGERVEELTLLDSLETAREHLRARPLDLVFLDLNLNGRDGLDLLAEAVASRFHTIVVSAYDEHALKAFEYGVTDYLVKPWTDIRLRTAVARVLGRSGAGAEDATRAARLAIRGTGQIELLDVARVEAIRGADDYSELLLADGTTRLHEKPLATLAAILPSGFARVHRSWIVQLARVRSWAPAPGGRATLDLGDRKIPVGRTYRRRTLARLGSG
jgi:two-component system, LytTR family, response regulator